MRLHNDLVQNTDPWLAFKATRPMSGSNAGACMGYGYPDCKNVEDLAQIHLGLKQRDFPDFLKKRMQVGHDLEPLIRQKVENQLQESFEPNVATNGDYMLSSDGINFDQTINLEIKTTGATTHCYKGAKTGDIIETHKWQMDHALLVTEFEKCVYAVYCDQNQDLIIMDYHRDESRIKRLIDGWKRFQELIADPAQLITEAVIPDDLEHRVNALLHAKDAKEMAEADFKAIKTELLAELPANQIWVSDLIKISVVNPAKPAIDYKALVEANKDKLSGVDFELFRKSPGKITQRINDNRR